VHVLKRLQVIAEADRVLDVEPSYVRYVIKLRAGQEGTTQAELNDILQADQKLSDHAEEAVVQFERRRLRSLGREVEAELVRRISQLDVGAGYDIESFDGSEPPLGFDRFIEVKASTRSEMRFFWSANEHRIAQTLNGKCRPSTHRSGRPGR
jgi:hypothetical protein